MPRNVLGIGGRSVFFWPTVVPPNKLTMTIASINCFVMASFTLPQAQVLLAAHLELTRVAC